MKNIRQVFSEIKTPKGWKDDLYGRIEREHSIKRGKIKHIGTIIAAAAAVLAVTFTAAAFSGLLDLGSILQKDFGDDISAAKVETGAYQSLGEVAENDIISVRASAFMGDYVDSYIMLEAKLGEGAAKEFSRLALDVRVYDETVVNPGRYYAERYYAVPKTDENGETTYVFKVKVPMYWISHSVESGEDIIVDIPNVCFEYESGSELFAPRAVNLKLSFAPDESIISEFVCIDMDRELIVCGEECKAAKFIPSDYAARIVIEYIIPMCKGGAAEFWPTGVEYGKKIAGICGDETVPSACPFTLLVDGESVPFADSPFLVYMTEGENGELPTRHFGCVLSYKTFDFASAESVIIEIDGEESIVIK